MSVMHVTMRLCVLPALVLGAGADAPLAPLALWPLGLLYGAAIVPAPGGGGAVELAFRAALANVIGPRFFAAALLWWRFYTFYIYIARRDRRRQHGAARGAEGSGHEQFEAA